MIKEIALKIPGQTDDFTPPVSGMPVGNDHTLSHLVQWGVTVLFMGASLLCFIFIIIGGVQWITSGGDKAGVESARKKVTWAVVGLVITFSSYVIMNFIEKIFGVNLV